MTRISGYEIYNYITAGANQLIHQETTLNAINVFPVADGDTGSNLAYTMKCILASAKPSAHVGDTLTDISEVALEDAYGNSGAIFASYLYGLSREVGKKESINIAEFSEMAYRAVNYAYDALAKPTEGTILTVMKAFGTYMKNHHTEHHSLSTLLSDAMVEVGKALKNTTHQLKVLADADVVDAGAQGFVYFLEGMRDYVVHGLASAVQGQGNSQAQAQGQGQDQSVVRGVVHAHDTTDHRYCTEFVFQPGPNYNKAKLFEVLEATDDAVIVQRIGEYVKVHTHTNHPEVAHGLVRMQGTVIKSKVDDMVFQMQLQKAAKRPIGIVTDSIASLSPELMASGIIYQIPLQLIVDGHTYSDQLTLKNEDLFDLLDTLKKPATSAQPGERLIEKNLRLMLNHFDHLIGVFVSSEMSGMYQKVVAAAKDLDPKRLTLMDSKTNSAAQGLMVHSVYEWVQAGLSPQEIARRLEDQRKKYRIYVEIPDLHYATLSGRVPKVVGLIAGVFNLKAIISIDEDGKGTVTRERSLFKKAQALAVAGRPQKYGVVYTGRLEDFEGRIETLTQIFGQPPVLVAEASNIVSAFIGRGALGFAVLEA